MTRASRPSAWFEDEDSLLGELRRGRRSATPVQVPGYDTPREIRRGGQGVVYRATQLSTKRDVAIKVLLDSASFTESGRRRFEREVDLAASLRHPGIVRVYDGGVLPDGRSYLVMEYVEGVPLDEYVARDAGNVRRTLEVFLGVCDAIQHAHLRGVIHRDLKPSNVRVDSDGHPRVLDFGLAKVGDGEAAERSGTPAGGRSITTSGQFVGSLPWSSPEQARGEHALVDTRSDVYSLGVVLYQMLTGRLPYAVEGPLNEALTNVVSAMPTPARRVRADLDEQLEVILGKALSKRPEDRYQSAADLADDVRHHLAGEPIRARRESAWKGLQRRARRYRAVGIAMGVALLAVSGATLVSVRWAREAEAKGDLASREARRAQREGDRARATVRFLQDLLSNASPDAAGGSADAKVVDAVDRAASRVDEAYAGDDRTKADLHATLGNIYGALDRVGASREHHARARDLYRSLPDSPEVRKLEIMSRVSHAVAYAYEGDFQAAVPPLREALEDYARQDLGKDAEVAGAFSSLGVCLRRLGDVPGAVRAYETGLAVCPDDAPGRRTHASLINNMASAYHSSGEHKKAEEMYRRAIDEFVAQFGEEYSEVLNTKSNLAVLYLDQLRPREAIEILEPLRPIAERVNGPTHRSTLILLNNIANAYEKLEEWDRALEVYEEAIRRYRLVDKQGTSYLVTPLSNIAGVYARAGRFDEGEAAARESYEIAARVLGADHESTLLCRQTLGVLYSRAGRVDEAIRELEHVHARFKSPDGPRVEPWRRALVGSTYAVALAQGRRFDDARRVMDESEALGREGNGPDSPLMKSLAAQRARVEELAAGAK